MLADEILTILKHFLPQRDTPIPLHEPCFLGNEWNYVKECLDTGWVSSIGSFVDKFEASIAQYTGHNYAVAVVNGTSGLHISLKLIGVMPNDEVLIPTLSFVATANAVTYCGAIPHFVDSSEKTLGLDPFKLRDYLKEIAEIRAEGCFNRQTGRAIRAVVPVHIFGHPVDLDPLMEVCRDFKLVMIEDGAEALGSLYKGKHIGHWGKCAVISFNGNKIITTGGGGIVLTNDQTIGKMAKHLITTAKVPHEWSFYHDQIGYNYRLPNLNAALGCGQMEKITDFIEKKRSLADRYIQAFSNLKGVRCFREPELSRSNYWLNALILDPEFSSQRDIILDLTQANGILTRPVWILMHKLPMFAHCPRMDLSVAEDYEKRLINIPSSANL